MKRLFVSAIVLLALPLLVVGEENSQQEPKAPTSHQKAKPSTQAQRSINTGRTHAQARATVGTNATVNNRNTLNNRNMINNRNVINSRSAINNPRMFNNANTVSIRNRVTVLRQVHNQVFFINEFGVNRFHFFPSFGFFFVFVDQCWVSAPVLGFPFSDQIICANSPAFFFP
jgi:hypothetical protein